MKWIAIIALTLSSACASIQPQPSSNLAWNQATADYYSKRIERSILLGLR